jgi:hypothetical protein
VWGRCVSRCQTLEVSKFEIDGEGMSNFGAKVSSKGEKGGKGRGAGNTCGFLLWVMGCALCFTIKLVARMDTLLGVFGTKSPYAVCRLATVF